MKEKNNVQESINKIGCNGNDHKCDNNSSKLAYNIRVHKCFDAYALKHLKKKKNKFP